MPRNYRPKPGSISYKRCDQKDIDKAISAVKRGMSYRKAEKAYGVPKNQIHRRIKNPDTKSPGGQPVLDTTLEDHIASRLVTCSDWGFPLDALDLRYLVKGYLDKRGLVEPRFKQNMPGTEWVTTFMKRQEQTLSFQT